MEGNALPGTIQVVTDEIGEQIEELSALTEAWQRQRDKGRTAPILRKAIIYAARDLWDEFAVRELED